MSHVYPTDIHLLLRSVPVPTKLEKVEASMETPEKKSFEKKSFEKKSFERKSFERKSWADM